MSIRASQDGRPRVAIFGPNLTLTVTLERRAESEQDDIHFHPGGQGVWVARMVATLGAEPILCGLIGGEGGTTLRPLLEGLGGQLRLVETAGGTTAYVTDRRSGDRRLAATDLAEPPSRHEIDELFSSTCAAALESDVLVVCNPFPGEILPLELYRDLVSDVRKSGTPVLVDLSSPRLDSALDGEPDLAKLNDWELAEFVAGPVDGATRLRAAAERLLEAGAGAALVTRGPKPALALRDGEALIVEPPSFEHGFREGCGDTMMGAMAAAWARGLDWREALTLGAAAGAANFLRHGLGTGSEAVVRELADRVRLTPA
jgi:1-phosphofructokinase